MTLKDKAVQHASHYFDEGGFKKDLSELIAVKTESQNQKYNLKNYYKNNIIPMLTEMGFKCNIMKNLSSEANVFLFAERIENHNFKLEVPLDDAINGRNLTNIGLFRKYIEEYLIANKLINTEMTVMCRQLSPTSQGVPLEIYAFISDKEWKSYENIVSDIFDHLLASLKTFDLELFELPSNLKV